MFTKKTICSDFSVAASDLSVIQNVRKVKLLNFNLLQPADTRTYLWVSGGYNVNVQKFFE